MKNEELKQIGKVDDIEIYYDPYQPKESLSVCIQAQNVHSEPPYWLVTVNLDGDLQCLHYAEYIIGGIDDLNFYKSLLSIQKFNL